MAKIAYRQYFYPGSTLNDLELNSLVSELRSVAKICLNGVPNYQVMTGKREDLKKVLLIVALVDNRIVGFSSALHLKVPGVGDVFHTGLTCVDPSVRGKRLTHKLVSGLLTSFIIKKSPFSTLWVSNCACVISSLGNIAMYFQDIYPSPKGPEKPTLNHLKIAKYINENCRDLIAINKDANFNEQKFVFEGSVEGTCFQKNEGDDQYNHRDPVITNYYKSLMNFSRGDEVLQIGQINLATYPKYQFKKTFMKRFNNIKNFLKEKKRA